MCVGGGGEVEFLEVYIGSPWRMHYVLYIVDPLR